MPPSELFQAWLATHSNNARQRILDQCKSTLAGDDTAAQRHSLLHGT